MSIHTPTSDYDFLLWMQNNPCGFVGNVLTQRNNAVTIHRSCCTYLVGNNASKRSHSRTARHTKLCGIEFNEVHGELLKNSRGAVKRCHACSPEDEHKTGEWIAYAQKIDFSEAISQCIGSDTTANNESSIGTNSPASYETRSRAFARDVRVVEARLAIAKGICESCGEGAPFLRKKTLLPYLEVHHIIPLSGGGPDKVNNTIALCPNCHRREHLGEKKHHYE